MIAYRHDSPLIILVNCIIKAYVLCIQRFLHCAFVLITLPDPDTIVTNAFLSLMTALGSQDFNHLTLDVRVR